jgi:NAD(P)-dependent dehydrogenase (short-subunit alcohol dehydrogenase family)
MAQTDRKVALVTSAHRGIGLEMCRRLAHQGMQVILTSHDISQGQAAGDLLRTEKQLVFFWPLDLRDMVQIRETRKYVESEFSRLDVLVNTAEMRPEVDEHVDAMEDHGFLDVLQVNFTGPCCLAHAFLPLMQHHRYGRVVHLSPGAAALKRLAANQHAFALSKIALNAFTPMIAGRVDGRYIKINTAACRESHPEATGKSRVAGVNKAIETILWLATLPETGPTGGLFYQPPEYAPS